MAVLRIKVLWPYLKYWSWNISFYLPQLKHESTDHGMCDLEDSLLARSFLNSVLFYIGSEVKQEGKRSSFTRGLYLIILNQQSNMQGNNGRTDVCLIFSTHNNLSCFKLLSLHIFSLTQVQERLICMLSTSKTCRSATISEPLYDFVFCSSGWLMSLDLCRIWLKLCELHEVPWQQNSLFLWDQKMSIYILLTKPTERTKSGLILKN